MEITNIQLNGTTHVCGEPGGTLMYKYVNHFTNEGWKCPYDKSLIMDSFKCKPGRTGISVRVINGKKHMDIHTYDTATTVYRTFIEYDKWFDDNIDPIDLIDYSNESEFTNSIHEKFYQMSTQNITIGSSNKLF